MNHSFITKTIFILHMFNTDFFNWIYHYLGLINRVWRSILLNKFSWKIILTMHGVDRGTHNSLKQLSVLLGQPIWSFGQNRFLVLLFGGRFVIALYKKAQNKYYSFPHYASIKRLLWNKPPYRYHPLRLCKLALGFGHPRYCLLL